MASASSSDSLTNDTVLSLRTKHGGITKEFYTELREMIQTDVSDQAIYMCVSRMHKAATQLKKGKNKDEVTNFLHRQFKVPVMRKED